MKNENLESKIENKVDREEKIRRSSFTQGVVMGATPIFLSALFGIFNLYFDIKKNEEKNIFNYVQNLKAYDINQDGRVDLISPKGEIFFQTKEGKFVSYKNILEQEKKGNDSIYNAKIGSAKKIYNKLEKSVD
jgi:hypothetical protein